jgi:hypothetical protein
MRLFLLVCLAGCYPVCVTDADCDNGACVATDTGGENRMCVPFENDDAGVDASGD